MTEKQAFPEAPMHNKWFYIHDGEIFGPTTSEHLKQLAASGHLQPTDEVWKDGMTKRLPASQVKGLYCAPKTGPPKGVS